jgi:hypothetical protein
VVHSILLFSAMVRSGLIRIGKGYKLRRADIKFGDGSEMPAIPCGKCAHCDPRGDDKGEGGAAKALASLHLNAKRGDQGFAPIEVDDLRKVRPRNSAEQQVDMNSDRVGQVNPAGDGAIPRTLFPRMDFRRIAPGRSVGLKLLFLNFIGRAVCARLKTSP